MSSSSLLRAAPMTLLAPSSLASGMATRPEVDVAPRIRAVKSLGSSVVRVLNAIQLDIAGFTVPAAWMGSRAWGRGMMFFWG